MGRGRLVTKMWLYAFKTLRTSTISLQNYNAQMGRGRLVWRQQELRLTRTTP